MKTSKKEVGKRIVKLRGQKELTQMELSSLTKIGQQRLSIIEAGDAYPTVEQLIALATTLKTTTDYILMGQEYESPDLSVIKTLVNKLAEATKNI